MKRLLAWAARAVLPEKVIDTLIGARDTLIGARATLAAIPQAPARWDEAAVQLNQLGLEVQRVGYPQYLYGLLCAARTARAIGANQFTAIEFGVAGGNGLVAMERHATTVEQKWGLSIRVVGFDTSTGLPQRADPRDCPFLFQGGEFKMDEPKLRARLHRADLRLGDVGETIPTFASENFPPVGFVANDLDLYTSTRDSFALFGLEPDRLLPRVTMYFDDLCGYPYTTVSGEWAAIDEFNSTHKDRRLGQISGLKHGLGRAYRFAPWNESFYVLHVFDHPAYNSREVTAQPCLNIRA